MKGFTCLVNHPLYGSLWLTDCEYVQCRETGIMHVVGEAEDRSVPEGHSTRNFPISCIRKEMKGQPHE